MRSAVPAFKKALLERLEKTKALAEVTVSWGNPYPDDAGDEVIIIGNTTGKGKGHVAGLSQANEVFSVDIIISVVGSAQTGLKELVERAYELAEAVDDSVIDWAKEPVKYGGVVTMVVPGLWSDGEAVTDDGDWREASVITQLDVTARIS